MDTILYNSTMNRLQYLEGLYQAKKQQFKKAEDTVKGLEIETILLSKTEKVLKQLIDKLVQNDMTKMDKLITYGINTVFPDRNFRFESNIEERGKKIYIDLKTLFDDNPLSDDSQCSVHVVESALLRIMSIIKLKRARVLFLDETFSAVRVDNLENVSKLLSQVAEKLGMDVLVVTHDVTDMRLSQYANNVLELSLKQPDNIVQIEKIRQ